MLAEPKSDIWEGDILDRQAFGAILTRIVKTTTESRVINLDSKWGTGKTFFLNRWEQDISRHHPTIIFNAWETDYLDDPIPAFIQAFQDQITLRSAAANSANRKKRLQKASNSLIKGVLPSVFKSLAHTYIGEEGTDAIFKFAADDEQNFADTAEAAARALISLQDQTRNVIEEFREALSDLVPALCDATDLTLPLVIVIDELDRCRPNYAISLLERIKHLFSIPGVVFVVATDSEQLSASICAVYGTNFDGRAYLRRFFDIVYSLPPPNTTKFTLLLAGPVISRIKRIDFLFPEMRSITGFDPEEFARRLAVVFHVLDLTLRDQQQCMAKLDLLLLLWSEKERIHYWWLIFLVALAHRFPKKFESIHISDETQWFSGLFSGIPNLENTGFDIETMQLTQRTLLRYLELFSAPYEELENRLEKAERSINPNNNPKPSFLQRVDASIYSALVSEYKILREYYSRVNAIQQIAQ